MGNFNPIIVVGGGGAGIVAAWKAASSGARVSLIERNNKLGIKLLISGGGKCNITHAGSVDDVCAGFIAREARFLKPSLYRFTNQAVLDVLHNEGVRTQTRENGRVFPMSGRAADVVAAFTSLLSRSGVHIVKECRVESIQCRLGAVTGVVTGGSVIPSSHVVVATGGASYPKTGTTGDGYGWGKEIGHTIVPVRAALAPIGIEPALPSDWRGVALRGGCLSVYAEGRKLSSWNDDILFTHEGLSGPAALEVSRTAAAAMEKHSVTLAFDFFPSHSFAKLDAELNRRVLENRGRMVETILESLLPNRIISLLLASIDVDPKTRGHVLTRDQRRAITGLLKEWKMGKVSRIDLARGEVTAGGIDLGEVDPQTMRSRKTRGLYLCGEVLDVAGSVGGYNLQAAFSTGFVAGESAARDWLAGRETHEKTGS